MNLRKKNKIIIIIFLCAICSALPIIQEIYKAVYKPEIVDGVEPNDATIASGEYPCSAFYYAVIKSDTPKNSPSRKLVSWLLSEEGQYIFTKSGFGGIKQ